MATEASSPHTVPYPKGWGEPNASTTGGKGCTSLRGGRIWACCGLVTVLLVCCEVYRNMDVVLETRNAWRTRPLNITRAFPIPDPAADELTSSDSSVEVSGGISDELRGSSGGSPGEVDSEGDVSHQDMPDPVEDDIPDPVEDDIPDPVEDENQLRTRGGGGVRPIDLMGLNYTVVEIVEHDIPPIVGIHSEVAVEVTRITHCAEMENPASDSKALPMLDWFLPYTHPREGQECNFTFADIDKFQILEFSNAHLDALSGLVFYNDELNTAEDSSLSPTLHVDPHVFTVGYWRYWGQHPALPLMSEMNPPIQLNVAASFLMEYSCEFYHYINEVFSKLIMMLDFLKANPDIPLIMNTDCIYASATVGALGLDTGRIIPTPSKPGSRELDIFQVETLYLGTFEPAPTYFMMSETYHLMHRTLIPVDAPQEYILVVNRKDRTSRRVSNHLEFMNNVRKAFPNETFVEFRGDAQSWEDSLAIWNKAKIVIAPHGAALVNLIWCGPGTKVLEFMHTNSMDKTRHGHFWYIAQAMGFEYWVQPVPGASMYTNYRINTKKALNIVRKMLGQEAPSE